MTVFDGAKQFRGNVRVEHIPLLYTESPRSLNFCLEIDGKKVAFLVAEKNIYDGKECMVIRRTWVDPAYRNNGYMKAMYNTLHNCGFVLISDKELSPESISVWKAMARGGRVQVINSKTEKIRNTVPTDFTEFNADTRFIMESGITRLNTPMDYDLFREHQIYINNRYKELDK